MTKPLRSIYQLADQTGVSASTVSRVLNQRAGIGDATRRKVLTAARAAGFRPRMTARQNTVAVVTDRNQYMTAGGFIPSLLSSLVQVLSQQEVAVELVTERNLDRLSERLVDGVLALAWDDATVEALRGLPDIPVVTINRMDVEGFGAVATNHRQQGEMVVDYFAQRGHRRLAIVCEEANNWGTRERVNGFLGRSKALDLDVSESSVLYTEHQPMYGLMRRLTSTVRPTGVFIANEDMGLEVTYILKDILGLAVPDDVSLIGMEASHVSPYLSPPMTTVCQPLEELAVTAWEVLQECMESGKPANGGTRRGPSQKMLGSRLIERESVAQLTPATDKVQEVAAGA